MHSQKCSAIRDVFVRSVGAERVFGVMTVNAGDHIGAFVDARDLAVSVKHVVLAKRLWTASELAHAVGIECTAPLKVTNSRGG